MDSAKNPFAPLPGSPPPYLGGRQPVLAQGRLLWARLKGGHSEPGLLLQGLGGSGKSVLLQALASSVREAGGQAAVVEAREGRPFGVLLVPALRSMLYGLTQARSLPASLRRALSILAGFCATHAPALGTRAEDPASVPGLGDSGDLEADLAAVLGAAGEAARESGGLLVLLIDEAQAFAADELSALLRAQLTLQQRGLPVGMVLAGLPLRESLSEDTLAVVGRLYQLVGVEALSEAEAAKALQVQGARFEPEAVRELWRLTKGHPALLQAWAYQLWNQASGPAITREDVRKAAPAALKHLDERFYGPCYEPLSPREKSYLRSMAHLGPGPHRSSDIADSMDAKITALGVLRAKLIKKGLVYSPGFGKLGFALPGFDEFMRRVMPNFR